MRTAFLTTQRLLSQIPALKYVDEDYGQLDHYETIPSVPSDCALISVNILGTNDITSKRQMCTADIIVRWWPDLVRLDTSNLAPEAMRTRSLSYYDTDEAIFSKLHGYRDDALDLFSRKSQGKEKRSDGLIIIRYTFSTTFEQIVDF